ncbi:MAG: hypothetical protein ABJL44_14005 [Algibacter sp.]
MKKFFILFTLIYSSTILSQSINTTHQFLGPIYNDNKTIQFKKGHKVYISEINTDSITFVYYNFIKGKDSIRQSKLNNTYVFDINKKLSGYNSESTSNNDGNDVLKIIKTHKLSLEDFKNYTTELYPIFKGVSAGIFTVPFKIRLNDFDFEQNVNIGMNLSFPFRLNRLKEDKDLLTPTIGLGLATINLNPKNSNLEVTDDEDTNRTASAFSMSWGLMYQFTNSINIGFQYGFDFLGNNDKEVKWKYDKKPWLGIGINIGLSLSDNKNSNANN